MYFGSWFQRIRLSLMGRHGKAVERMWERVVEYLKHGGPGIKAIKASPFISCAYHIRIAPGGATIFQRSTAH